MKVNLDIVFQKPEKTVKTMLTIEPLAPLSMVDTMPGSFYKTLAEPSKYHLSGAFENALGWHFGNTDLKEIRKHIETIYRKELNEDLPDWSQSDVGFPPLLIHLFDVGMTCKPAMIFYKDLWKQMRKRRVERQIDFS